MNLRNRKRLPITMLIIVLFVTALKAQSDMGSNNPDTQETKDALYSLELIAGSIKNELKYDAPPVEPSLKAAELNSRNEKLATRRTNRPVQVESADFTMQEAWLIKSGYCKTTSTPQWRQAKKTFGGR